MALQVCLYLDNSKATRTYERSPPGISLRQTKEYYDSTTASDTGLNINWREEGVKAWPFWLHESCVSETFEHMYRKAIKYVHGSKFHISILSILNLENRNSSPGQPQDWQVDLSIWRIGRELFEDNKYRPKPEMLLDRVVVYPRISNTLPTVTIFKQDLVTLSRHEDQDLLDIKMEIVLSDVYEVAEIAVGQMQTRQLKLPSNVPNSDQIGPSSPLMGGSNASYQAEEGSEKAASQLETDDTLSPIEDGSQDDLEGEVDNEEASISSSSEGDDKIGSIGASKSTVEQRTKEGTAKIEEDVKEEGLNSLRRRDTSEVDTLPK